MERLPQRHLGINRKLMVQVLTYERGYVYAYIEYSIVDIKGQFKDLGEYCFVHHLWIHPEHRVTSFNPHWSVLPELIQKMNKDKFMQNVRFIYWLNLKHKERQVIFPRKRLQKIGEENGKRWTASRSTAS
jgi:hypothetical protein